jgi:deoxyribodipyrimidine photo-lyase
MLELDDERLFPLNQVSMPTKGDVYYWMTREQRIEDNWSLIFASSLARERGRNVHVVLFLSLGESLSERSHEFMLQGLTLLSREAKQRGLSFRIYDNLEGEDFFLRSYREGRAAAVVCDFHPLRVFRKQRERAAQNIPLPFWEVDSHNICPCRRISFKQEYGAYHLRKKIEPLLTRYLTDHPSLESVLEGVTSYLQGEELFVSHRVELDRIGSTSLPLLPGFKEGMIKLTQFLQNRWESYDEERNNPAIQGQSGLSPYLHFGQISPQTVAWEALKREGTFPSLKGSFFDELIVRRELSDNFCWYNHQYDRVSAFPAWARMSLNEHREDRREFLYSLEEWEEGRTHDKLWNGAQFELVHKGKMHGYMRMYWAKKILQWSPSYDAAWEWALYLNDKYSLDGQDPNGYAGCAWAIGGLHDRAWQERGVFGKIRYMNDKGCRRKFDVDLYIKENSYE